ncbi:MAG: helicase C-terminal domain-containing protein [Spirochaetia bacterium]|jgi:ATP-dependent DNA helicase DinG|nr:helicase C-terminal domain-containing protein [Spirochaetia bacterium]
MNERLHSAVVESRERLAESVCMELKEAISSAGGGEIFAVGSLDSGGKVSAIEVVARGNSDAVPALGSYFEKGSVLIHNHPSGRLQPSEPDVAIAAEAGSFGVGSYIIDNDASLLYIVAEPARRRSLRMLDEEGLSRALDKGGALAKTMRDFEPRPSQVQMTADVASVFNHGGILAAEAGTGVGKSFAYLLPAIGWAQGNEERVVISTATINLQDQLFSKDLPVVSSIFRKKPKTVLVKGRANYLCKRRLQEAIDEEGLMLDEQSPIKRIAAWDEAGGNGDRAALPFRVDDQTWGRICSEAEACVSLRCPHREKCHVIAVRKNAADAQIIVVNHHLLFADIASRRRNAGVEQTSILPSYNVLVLDEAHAIEDSATSLFTESLSRFSLLKKLSQLWRKKGRGFFGSMASLAVLPSVSSQRIQTFEARIQEVQGSMASLEALTLGIMGDEASLRLKEKTPAIAASLCEAAGRLQRSILALSKELADILEALPEAKAQEAAAFETRMVARSLNESADLLARMKDFDANPDTVFWIEKSRSLQKETFVYFNATPLEVAPLLEKSVFEKLRSVVCTSATLAVGGSFDFWMKRVGIAKQRQDLEARIYPSPFPFGSNAVLAVDPQAPHPQRQKAAYREYIPETVLRLLLASRGRALVLFTSYEMLGASFEKARPVLESEGISCLRQGMDERSRLLAMFRNDIFSVLFATDSFWEGVDAPGETLSMVVLTKLPFKVPDEPVLQARAEAVEKAGGNAFMEISVPEAIIKFKQGFGRLIRHSQDRGVAVVLDQRLATSRYGSLFIESLPRCKLVSGGRDILESEIRRFLDD